MNIETFQKIQQRLINLTLLPVSFFVAISLYFWQSLWDKHTLLTMIAFVASSLSCFYYLSVNISTKPWVFLKQTYFNNKKYKTLRKIQQPKSQEDQKSAPSLNVQKSKQTLKKTSAGKSVHLTFSAEDQQQTESSSQSTEQIQPLKKTQKTIDSPLKRIVNAKNLQTKGKSSSKYSNQLDPVQMFLYTSKQNQSQKDRKFNKKFNSDQIDKTQEDLKFQKQSQQVKRCIGNFINKQLSQEILREEFDNRYIEYKKSLQQLQINQQVMERLNDETKLIIRQKIEQNLKKQHENLDNIQSILRKNFSVNFKSYKQRSQIQGVNTFYGQRFGYSGINQNRDPYSQGRNRGQNLNKPLKFSEVLQECVNLMNHNYFNFEYTGQVQKIDEIKNQLKLLLKQRLRLDEYLFLRKSLSIDSKNRSHIDKKKEFKSEFEEERYLHLLKLKNLAQILGEKRSAQQNLLKQFFSTQRAFFNEANQPLEQINDEKNIEFFMSFMIKVFQEKLSDANATDYIEIKLSKPDFSNPSINCIWVEKAKSLQSHYNLTYTCNTKKSEESKENGQVSMTESSSLKKEIPKPITVNCCPGESNIWVCFTLIRQIISKIGLKQQKYPMIKDKELRKDFERLFELLK